MTKWLPVLAVSAASGVACTWMGAPAESSATPVTPEPAASANVESFQSASVSQLYDQNCAKCHGENGDGGGAGTSTFLTKELFDQKHDRHFFDVIKNGLPDGSMDKYGETLSDRQIWGLVVHVRELQGRALRAEFGSPRAVNGVYPSPGHPYRVETVIARDAGLRTPWGMDWLPDGRMLITNKGGVLSLTKGNAVLAQIEGIPAVNPGGQGGLMEVTVHPQYSRNGWVYLGFSDIGRDNPNTSMTKIVRGKLKFEGERVLWTSQETIFEAPQSTYLSGGLHFGNRIVFDGKGHVYFGIGERGRMDMALDLSKPNGKIFRVREDGTIPSDNPFVNEPNALKAIWSYGHRNPQGLAMDQSGNLWDTEHGPRGGDEVNLIKKGANYGWPLIAFSINYNDAPFQTPWPAAGQKLELPAFRWIPSTGACGLDVVKGPAFPKWRGDLVAGGLVGANIDRLRFKDGKFVEREELIHGMGRVRDVSVGPDGFIYAALNQPDMVIRIVPAK